MEIVRQVLAKEKALYIIESCETMEQYNSAENYMYLYFNKFEDRVGLEELKRCLKEHRINMLNPNN